MTSPLIPPLKSIRKYVKRRKNSGISNLHQRAISAQMSMLQFQSMILNAKDSTRFIPSRCCGWIQCFILFLIALDPYYIITECPHSPIFLLMLLFTALFQLIGGAYCYYLHCHHYLSLHKTLRNCKRILGLYTKQKSKGMKGSPSRDMASYEISQIPLQMWFSIPIGHFVNFNEDVSNKNALNVLYASKSISILITTLFLMMGQFPFSLIYGVAVSVILVDFLFWAAFWWQCLLSRDVPWKVSTFQGTNFKTCCFATWFFRKSMSIYKTNMSPNKHVLQYCPQSLYLGALYVMYHDEYGFKTYYCMSLVFIWNGLQFYGLFTESPICYDKLCVTFMQFCWFRRLYYWLTHLKENEEHPDWTVFARDEGYALLRVVALYTLYVTLQSYMVRTLKSGEKKWRVMFHVLLSFT